jgi:hypothetical protein
VLWTGIPDTLYKVLVAEIEEGFYLQSSDYLRIVPLDGAPVQGEVCFFWLGFYY